MRTEYLMYFLETVKAGSFNKASQALDVTHQTVSTGITNLENELDVQLVIRDQQGIALTPAGKEAVIYAQTLLETTERFKRAMGQFKPTAAAQKPKGHLNVLYTPLINMFVIPYLTDAFLMKYPHITLHFTEMEGVEVLKALQNNKGDLGLFALSTAIRSDRAFCAWAKPLLPEKFRLCAVVSYDHPLAKRRSISIKTLIKYPLTIYQAGDTPGTLQNMLRSYGELNLALITSNLLAYERYIATGQAIGFLPKIGKKKTSLGSDEQKLVYIPIKETPDNTIAYALATELPSAQESLCQLLIDEVKAMF